MKSLILACRCVLPFLITASVVIELDTIFDVASLVPAVLGSTAFCGLLVIWNAFRQKETQ